MNSTNEPQTNELSISVNTDGDISIIPVSKARVAGVSTHLISRYKTHPMSVLDEIQKEAKISNQQMINLIDNINSTIFSHELSVDVNETSQKALEILTELRDGPVVG